MDRDIEDGPLDTKGNQKQDCLNIKGKKEEVTVVKLELKLIETLIC